MSVASQDVYLNVTTPLTVIGSGGGGTVPANLVASTITLDTGGSISGVSTINGTSYPPAAGAVPANLVVSTLTVGASTINGVSTINGAPYVAGAVPANLSVSSLAFNAPGASVLFNASTLGAYSTFNMSMSRGIIESFVELVPRDGTVGQNPYTQVGLREPATNDGSSVKVYRDTIYVSALSTLNFQAASAINLDLASGGVVAINGGGILNAPAINNVSSINSAAYPPAPLPNATLSTLALSTLGVPVGVAPFSTMQTVNSQIGNLRIQSGVVEANVAGVTITYQTPFSANPIVTTGVVSVSGTNVNAVVSGAGTTQATFSVDTVGALPAVPVTYTAIGLA